MCCLTKLSVPKQYRNLPCVQDGGQDIRVVMQMGYFSVKLRFCLSDFLRKFEGFGSSS